MLVAVSIAIIVVVSGLWGRIAGQATGRLMKRLREWWAETHSTGFELRRHFFFRFFDSELVSTPGQWKVIAGGALGIVASLSIVFIQAYYHKYRVLNDLDTPEPFRMAMLADVLFLVTLSMTVTGLFATLLWPSLFPGLRDYLALASLPVRTQQLFTSRFSALLALAAVFICGTNLLPSGVLPAVSRGDWAGDNLGQIPSLFCSMSLAAAFVFFSLVTVQGLLLNILPVRVFPGVSLAVQGALLALLLCGFPLVFSIPNLQRFMTLRPGWAYWLPPVWFMGLEQLMVKNQEPFAIRAAWFGIAGTGAAACGAVLTYRWSYRRHKRRLIESPAMEAVARRLLPVFVTERVLPDSRELAVFAFISKMLARSRQHRLALTAFAALGVAVVFESFASLALGRSFRGFSVPTPALRQAAISAPLALSLFVLAGFRYLFRLPIELRANWVFQMNEPGNRLFMLTGVEKFMLYCGVVPVALLTLPMQLALLGPAEGFAACATCLMISTILMEALLIPFDRIPFTSSYLPGRRPLIETVVRYAFGVALYVSALSAIVAWCVQTSASTVVLSAVLFVSWWKARSARVEAWRIGRLEFEETMEPAVQTLSIDRD